MTIRDRIFARISELDITQKEFAKRTGIPETTVSDWPAKIIAVDASTEGGQLLELFNSCDAATQK